MNAGFSTQILAQKLAKLNMTQQSIETLSHWCVFHHRHCRQAVETWDSEFRSAPCERRISLLYLANDIMQNSRKEGNRYISEFLRVIPAALNDVFNNGDDFCRNVVQRLGQVVVMWALDEDVERQMLFPKQDWVVQSRELSDLVQAYEIKFNGVVPGAEEDLAQYGEICPSRGGAVFKDEEEVSSVTTEDVVSSTMDTRATHISSQGSCNE